MSHPAPAAGRIVLASGSDRRLAILEKAGFEVTVIPSGVTEDWPEAVAPREAVVILALRKLRAVKARACGLPVLSADTEVVLDGRPLGKPACRPEAEKMLRQLSGRRHMVYSGVALGVGALEWSDVAEAEVEFRALSEKDIASYLDREEYGDKAGSYGIQNAGDLAVVTSGAVDTVVGLPLDVVQRLWKEMACART